MAGCEIERKGLEKQKIILFFYDKDKDDHGQEISSECITKTIQLTVQWSFTHVRTLISAHRGPPFPKFLC